MKTDLDNAKGTGWERSSNFVRQQSAEEVITRKADGDSAKRKTDRAKSAKAKRNRDRNILIIGAVAVVLVIVLIFSGGKSWQRRIDKKEIDTLSQKNAELQSQVQSLEQEKTELQNSLTSVQKQPENTTSTSKNTSGTTHVLQTTYNFRSEPSVDSDVLDELDEGVSVTIVKEMSDGWVQVQYNGQTGYLKCADELTSAGGSESGNTQGTSDSQEDSDSQQDNGSPEE